MWNEWRHELKWIERIQWLELFEFSSQEFCEKRKHRIPAFDSGSNRIATPDGSRPTSANPKRSSQEGSARCTSVTSVFVYIAYIACINCICKSRHVTGLFPSIQLCLTCLPNLCLACRTGELASRTVNLCVFYQNPKKHLTHAKQRWDLTGRGSQPFGWPHG